MTKTIRGILINPTERTVTPVDFVDTLAEIYRLCDCRCIEAVQVGEAETMYVDEEGLLVEQPKPFFSFAGREKYPICGNGLITGFDIHSGENRSTRLLPADVAARVVWRNIELTKIKTTTSDTENGFEIRVTSHFQPKED